MAPRRIDRPGADAHLRNDLAELIISDTELHRSSLDPSFLHCCLMQKAWTSGLQGADCRVSFAAAIGAVRHR